MIYQTKQADITHKIEECTGWLKHLINQQFDVWRDWLKVESSEWKSNSSTSLMAKEAWPIYSDFSTDSSSISRSVSFCDSASSTCSTTISKHFLYARRWYTTGTKKDENTFHFTFFINLVRCSDLVILVGLHKIRADCETKKEKMVVHVTSILNVSCQTGLSVFFLDVLRFTLSFVWRTYNTTNGSALPIRSVFLIFFASISVTSSSPTGWSSKKLRIHKWFE